MDPQLYSKTLISFIAIFVGLVLIFNRKITSFVDPYIYIFIYTASCLSLGIYVCETATMLERLIISFIILITTLFISSLFIQAKRPSDVIIFNENSVDIFGNFVFFASVLILIVNMPFLLTSGVIIFGDNAGVDKADAFTGGYGFIRRIDWSLGVFLMMSSVFLLIYKITLMRILSLLLSILVTVTPLGKSCFIPALLSLGIYFIRPFYNIRNKLSYNIIISAVFVFIPLSLIPSIIILSSDKNYSGILTESFLIRLLSFGDVLYYWGNNSIQNQFHSMGFFDYLMYASAPILGAFRIITYEPPLGNQLLHLALSPNTVIEDSVGPNIPFFVRGEIFFGHYLCFVYSFIVSLLVSYARRLLFKPFVVNPIKYSLIAYTNYLVINILIDESLAISQAFDFICSFILFWLFFKVYKRCLFKFS